MSNAGAAPGWMTTESPGATQHGTRDASCAAQVDSAVRIATGLNASRHFQNAEQSFLQKSQLISPVNEAQKQQLKGPEMTQPLVALVAVVF